MMLSTEIVSRLQFAFTITFHILFPSFSIGLVTFIAIMEGFWLATRNRLYLTLCFYWTKIFALTFGMGVVSGVVMEFQFGTNWAGFTYAVGPVLGSLFTYEVLTAFFIEAGFLGVMLFGWNKVGPKLHFFSTLLVVLGVTFSAFWILSANSWMQFPTGAHLVHDQFKVDDWWKVVFNPLVIPRWIHMLLAAYLATSFVIAAVAAHYLLNKRHVVFATQCLSFVMWGILILIPIQLFMGDTVGRNVFHYQPIKTAAIEGVWETTSGAPLLLFAYPDQHQERNLFAVGIPKLASLLNTHQLNGKIQGLKSIRPSDQPLVAPVFYSFRIMVGMGLLMLMFALMGVLLRWRGRLFDAPFFLKALRWSAPIGFFAILTGWFTAELGRQPWVVYQYLRTSLAISHVTVSHVIISMILIVLVYGVIFGVFYIHYLAKLLKEGPPDHLKIDNLPFSYLREQTMEKQA